MNKIGVGLTAATIALSSVATKAQKTTEKLFIKNDSIHIITGEFKNINLKHMDTDQFVRHLQKDTAEVKPQKHSFPLSDKGLFEASELITKQADKAFKEDQDTYKASKKLFKLFKKPSKLIEKINIDAKIAHEMDSISKTSIGLPVKPNDRNAEMFLDKSKINLVMTSLDDGPEIPISGTLGYIKQLQGDTVAIKPDTIAFDLNKKGTTELTKYLKKQHRLYKKDANSSIYNGNVFDADPLINNAKFVKESRENINTLKDISRKNIKMRDKATNKIK